VKKMRLTTLQELAELAQQALLDPDTSRAERLTS
jgi:hypothetical protein